MTPRDRRSPPRGDARPPSGNGGDGSIPARVLRSREAVEAQLAYEDEMRQTPEACAIDDLRQDAIACSEAGDLEKAHGMFLAAAQRCGFEDQGALAAACFYDLAESFGRRRQGVEIENLLEAKRLFERALRSPIRQRTPLRLALTLDALGRVLRRLSERPGPERATCFEASRANILRACELMEACGPVALIDAAGYRTNLGNLLTQGGQWDAAERNYRLALRHWDNALTDPRQLAFYLRPPSMPVPALILLGLSSAQIARGRRDDLSAVLAQLDRVIRDGGATLSDRARLFAAQALLAHRPEQTEAIHAHLLSVDLAALEGDDRRHHVALLEEAGLADAALRAARLAVHDTLVSRSATIADHVSDHLAAEAQTYSLAIARIHADHGRPVEAFLALEETAALRYFEAVLVYGWAPRDPVSRALANRRQSLALAAKWLEEIAGHLSEMSDAEQRAHLAELARLALEPPPPAARADVPPLHRERFDAGLEVQPLLAGIFADALASSTLATALERGARRLGDESLRVAVLLEAREPGSDQHQRSLDAQLDPPALRRVLDGYPGEVFVRVHLGAELFAVAVWSERGRTAGRTLRRPLDAATTEALLALYAGARGSNDAEEGAAERFAALPALLRALCLDDVLPAGDIAHLVLLPSMLAPMVPWAASGGAGRVLIDRVDALSYAPNLTPFVIRQDVPERRAGTLLVAPGAACEGGPTRLHELAFGEAGAHESALMGAAATRAAVLDAVCAADVVSFYTHGRHEAGSGASVVLADGSISTNELNPEWIGCERVELWTCESGVNTATDWLTPFVDEAFGLDVAFHHVGVRSTVGSLWSVSEFVTARLVRRYRRALAEGQPAPQALVTAQRWWRTEVVARLPALLANTPEVELPRVIAGLLGGPETDAGLNGLLAAVRSDAPASGATRDALLRRFSAPEAWAGFRFMGVADRRPVEVEGDAAEVMSEAGRAELAALLATAPLAVHRGTPRRRGH